jgi:hypothetical protein
MFYCDECAEKNGYPITIIKSEGTCEICGCYAICNDVKSSELPKPKDIFSRFAGTALFPDFPKKKRYPIIKVPANGHPDWYEGARTWCFVYSKNHGNFILEGYRGEVEKYLKENYTHYFCYISMWSNGRSRGNWHFWKDNIGIFTPDKHRKDWKYMIRPYTGGRNQLNADDVKEKTLRFKRLPKRWIPEFNQF